MNEPDISESSRVSRAVIRHPLLRMLVFVCGWLSVVLGVIGIFLPVMPTTPFLLLAAACFIRTSPRFYQWLIAHPHLGKYLIYYLDGKGMPKKAKVYTLLLMWTSLLLTAFVFTDRTMLKILLPLIGLGVSIYILRLPTLEPEADGDQP
ncbi:YbaN family protein [Thalassolituus sp. LLYu03]|uniref:YbaN family protein n=1 Tax=Thalassolituus sp. LLYu03 TaxID=3421656 RepID=UPI003D2C7C9B